MKILAWLVLSIVGLGIMIGSYWKQFGPDTGGPWAAGLLVLDRGERPDGPAAVGEGTLPGLVVPARARLLPVRRFAEEVLRGVASQAKEGTLRIEGAVRPKLLELSFDDARIGPALLRSGRLPVAGRDEVLAGPGASTGKTLDVDGMDLEVVGVLKSSAVVLADCYLMPSSAATALLFDGPPDAMRVHRATLVGLTREQARDRSVFKTVREKYPESRFTFVVPMGRMPRRLFQAYLAGQALFLLGGSGLLIGLFRWLARLLTAPPRVVDEGPTTSDALPARPRWYAAPLVELARWPRLLWGVHLVYFGLVSVGALAIYELPEVQAVLMSAVQDQLSGKERGPLAMAGAAYGSGNIPRAAAVTFVINFFIGSVLCITLPSIVFPGVGLVIAVLRPLLWGFLLAPTTAVMALGMVPHSGTLLLEGEGYLLAAFFGLLVPIKVVQASTGDSVGHRFRRVLLLNLQACALIAVVLGVAAVYEAIEVIGMAR